MDRLNLGCGRDVKKGWVNLDCSPLEGVDVVHDIETLPLPFASDSFDMILAKDVLEHVDYIPILKELHRILREGGQLEVQVPHFTSAANFIDPTHRKRFSIRTFDFFAIGGGTGREYYFDFAFSSIQSKRLIFYKSPLIFNYLVEPLANISRTTQKYYEQTMLSRLFPADNIRVVLVK